MVNCVFSFKTRHALRQTVQHIPKLKTPLSPFVIRLYIYIFKSHIFFLKPSSAWLGWGWVQCYRQLVTYLPTKTRLKIMLNQCCWIVSVICTSDLKQKKLNCKRTSHNSLCIASFSRQEVFNQSLRLPRAARSLSGFKWCGL